MVSITERIKHIKQPVNGYIKTKDFFQLIQYEDDFVIEGKENVSEANMLTTLCHLVEYLLTESEEEKSRIFDVSKRGAELVNESGMWNLLRKNITQGFDHQSVESACFLTSYEIAAKSGVRFYNPLSMKTVTVDTVNNLRIMLFRVIQFLQNQSDIIHLSPDLSDVYTNLISSGTCDIMTDDMLVNISISKNKITKNQALELVISYIMSKRRFKDNFSIRKLAIFNPRHNTLEVMNVDDLSNELINEISEYVIGYKKDDL